MIQNIKLGNFAGGTIGRVPDSAQYYKQVVTTLRTLTRTSTGGKENRDRTRKIKPTIYKKKAGQALVILLVFIATATIITAAAVTVTIINSQATGKLAQGQEALAIAETGAENAIERIIRDPQGAYTGETNTAAGNGTFTITVSNSGTTKTITATGTVGAFTRKIQVTGTFSGDKFTPDPVTFWQETN
jgi:hypothetical protein